MFVSSSRHNNIVERKDELIKQLESDDIIKQFTKNKKVKKVIKV